MINNSRDEFMNAAMDYHTNVALGFNMPPNIYRDPEDKDGQRHIFPVNVFEVICSFLSPSDARSLRFCCKTLARVGDEYGFQDLTFNIHKPDFDMLRTFASRPTISKSIKTLTYGTVTLLNTRYPLYCSLEEYTDLSAVESNVERVKKAKQNWLPEGAFDNTPVSIEDIRENYRQYEIAVQAQYRIKNQKEEFNIFKEILPKFTALEKITIWDQDYGAKSFDAFFAPSNNSRHEQHIQAVMYALCESTLRLRRLDLGIVPSIMNQAFFEQITPALKYLKCIELFVDEHEESDDDVHPADPLFLTSRNAIERGALANLVAALPRLEELRIERVDSGDQDFHYPFYELVSPGHKWDHLRHVDLHELRTERQDLIAFFQRHRHTLKSVSISNCILETTSCKILLHQMLEILDLKEILVEMVMEGQFEEYEDKDGFTLVPGTDELERQKWWFGEHPLEADSLGAKVADWFLRDGPCPLVPGIQYIENPYNFDDEDNGDPSGSGGGSGDDDGDDGLVNGFIDDDANVNVEGDDGDAEGNENDNYDADGTINRVTNNDANSHTDGVTNSNVNGETHEDNGTDADGDSDMAVNGDNGVDADGDSDME